MVSKGVAYGAAAVGIAAAIGGLYYGITKEPREEQIPITLPDVVGPGVLIPAQLQPRGSSVFTKNIIGW